MKTSLLFGIILLAGCGMSHEEFNKRVVYCESIGTKAVASALANNQVEKVHCIDEQGNKFRSKTLGVKQ